MDVPVGHDARVRPAAPAPPSSTARRVNLIERQRDQGESKAVSFARAPQRPGSRDLLVAAVRRATRGSGVATRLHRYQPGSGRRNVSPATGGLCDSAIRRFTVVAGEVPGDP